jgi:hypothetical protein
MVFIVNIRLIKVIATSKEVKKALLGLIKTVYGCFPETFSETPASNSNPGVISALIQNGVDINAKDEEGKTPLMIKYYYCYLLPFIYSLLPIYLLPVCC